MKARLVVVMLLLVSAVPVFGQSVVDINSNTIGKLGLLSERAAGQYLMYQYGIGDLAASKGPLLDTVDHINGGLELLRRGDPEAGISAVLAPAVQNRLDTVITMWRQLEKIYSYQPYKLLQHRELLPPAVRTQDPVLVRYVDLETAKFQDALSELAKVLAEHCDAGASDFGTCTPTGRLVGEQMRLVESVAKNALFVILEVDPDQRRKATRATYELLQANFASQSSPAEQQAGLLASVRQTIAAYWNQMQASLQMVLSGDEDDVSISQLLRSKDRLLEEIDNMAALRRNL